MEIRGQRLVLRPWREGDEPALVRHGDSRQVWRNLTDLFPHPYTRADAEHWVRTANQKPADELHLAIVVDSGAVGGVGFGRLGDLHTLSAGIGYWLGEAYWGRGLATEALGLASRHAFSHFDFVRLQAEVLDWNPASRRVLEKSGYQLEGRLVRSVHKDGEICDSWLYAALRPEA